MKPFEEDAEVTEAGKQCFNNILEAIKEKDTKKTAVGFYNIVKTTYAYAKKEDLLEKDKEEIDVNLMGVKALIAVMMLSEGWIIEQLTEFDKEVNRLWVIG